MVSVFVCQVGHPGLSPAWSVCFRKEEFYQYVINLSPPVPMTGSPKAIHVLCLCDNACKKFLAICHKSRASCPVSRLLSVPIWPACAKQGRKYDSIKQKTTILVTFICKSHIQFVLVLFLSMSFIQSVSRAFIQKFNITDILGFYKKIPETPFFGPLNWL